MKPTNNIYSFGICGYWQIKTRMKKVIRDGKVAVLISPGFGAGWFSWNQELPQLLFHPAIVEKVEQGKRDEITEEWVKELLGVENHVCVLGADQLEVCWLTDGERFYVEEYDGSEQIITTEHLNLHA